MASRWWRYSAGPSSLTRVALCGEFHSESPVSTLTSVGFARVRIDEVFPSAVAVGGELVGELHLFLDGGELVAFAAQGTFADGLAPLGVVVVVEEEDVELVLASLPTVLRGGELQRQVAGRRDAELADELLGRDAVQLERALLYLGVHREDKERQERHEREEGRTRHGGRGGAIIQRTPAIDFPTLREEAGGFRRGGRSRTNVSSARGRFESAIERARASASGRRPS